MVGYQIVSSRCTRNSLVTNRTKAATDKASIAESLPLNADERARAIETAVIPTIMSGTQWTWPSNSALNALTSAIVRAIWGRRRELRATEIVLAVLHEAHRHHPLWAMIYRTFCDARRYLRKHPDNYAQAIRILHHITTNPRSSNITGPITTLIRGANELGGRLTNDPDRGGLIIELPDYFYFPLHDSDSGKDWQQDLQYWIYRACVANLQ